MTTENVQLKYRSELLEGWSSVSVTMGADKTANGFSMTATRGNASLTKPAITGQPIEVIAGGDVVLTGMIEKYDATLDVSEGGRRLNVSGRSKTGILVKSDAQGSFRGLNTLQIIRKLTEEWGIEIETTLTDWITHDVFTVNTGQKIHEVIHGLLSLQKATATCSANGKLRIFSADQARSQGGVSKAQHVLSARFEADETERFGEYTAKGQDAAFFRGVQASEVIGKSFDLGATGRRIYYPKTEARTGNLKENAERAANRSFGKSRSLNLELSTWRNEAGEIWQPGAKLMCEFDEWELAQELIIDTVTLNQSVEDGTKASLKLVPLEAYKGKAGTASRSGSGATSESGGNNIFKTVITGKKS